MKQLLTFLIIIFYLLVFFISCESHSEKSSAIFESNTNTITNVTTDNTSDYIPKYNTETVYLVECSSNNIISVDMPNLDHELNYLIYDYVCGYLEEITGSKYNLSFKDTDIDLNNFNYSNYYIDVEYRISYRSTKLVSIIFEGLLNNKNAAHPIHLFFSINIKTANAQQLYFKDLYLIDSELYNTFSKYAIRNLKDKLNDKFTGNAGELFKELCPIDSFLAGINLERGFFVYYTSDGIGISYPVEYALGNHIEVEIPYFDLEDKLVIN